MQGIWNLRYPSPLSKVHSKLSKCQGKNKYVHHPFPIQTYYKTSFKYIQTPSYSKFHHNFLHQFIETLSITKKPYHQYIIQKFLQKTELHQGLFEKVNIQIKSQHSTILRFKSQITFPKTIKGSNTSLHF